MCREAYDYHVYRLSAGFNRLLYNTSLLRSQTNIVVVSYDDDKDNWWKKVKNLDEYRAKMEQEKYLKTRRWKKFPAIQSTCDVQSTITK